MSVEAPAAFKQSDFTQEPRAKRARTKFVGPDKLVESGNEKTNMEKTTGYDSSSSERFSSQGTSPEYNTPYLTPDTNSDDSSVSLHLGYADGSKDNLAGLMKHVSITKSQLGQTPTKITDP